MLSSGSCYSDNNQQYLIQWPGGTLSTAKIIFSMPIIGSSHGNNHSVFFVHIVAGYHYQHYL